MGDDIFGGTGNIGHLFVYHTLSGESVDLGVGYPGLSTVYSLVAGPDGRVYGISGSTYTEAHLYSLDPDNPLDIQDEGVPIPTSTEGGSLVRVDNKIYGGARDAAVVFAFDVQQGTFQTWDVGMAGISGIEALVLGPDGRLYGGGYAGWGQGRLFRFDPALGVAVGLGTPVPGDTHITGLVVGPDERVYGGTAISSGYVFAYDPAAGTTELYGAPVWLDNEINGLIRGSDGLLYGVTGWQRGRLFRFDPLHYPLAPAAGSATSISITPRFRELAAVPSTSEVWAMTTAADGRIYLSGYGPTVLTRWDPASESMETLGQVPGGASVVYALLELPNGLILGGGGTYGGIAVLFTYDPATGQFTGLPFYIFGENIIHSLTLCPNGVVYGSTGGQSGWLFAYNPANGEVFYLGSPVPDQYDVLSVVCSPDGLLYGGTSPEAYLFVYNPATGQSTAIVQPVPGETELWALAWGADGRLYGGTGGYGVGAHGVLFAYDPLGQGAEVIGQPFPLDSDVYDLAAGADGRLYGVTGGLEGHLFTFDPAGGDLTDRGRATLPDNNAYSLALSADARSIYVGTGYNYGLLAEYDTTYRFAWLEAGYSAQIPPGTQVAVDVVDAAGNVLVPDLPPGGSLLGLSTVTDPAIQLRATLVTSNTAATPALLEWSVTWSQDPKLALDPAALAFRVAAGGPPHVETVAITNESGGELPWTIVDGPDWLSVYPPGGTAPTQVTVTAGAGGLAPGVYNATLVVDGPPDCLNCPVSVPVTMEVAGEVWLMWLPVIVTNPEAGRGD